MDHASKEFLRLYSLLLEERDADREQKILDNRDALQAYCYAVTEIKGRWPEAEEFIKKNAEYAYDYAIDIIKGRWPEAEEFIKKNAGFAYLYATYVIKGRWPEAEEYIKEDKDWWPEYKSLICEECNGEGVIDYGIGGAEEECPTCFGKGFDPAKLN